MIIDNYLRSVHFDQIKKTRVHGDQFSTLSYTKTMGSVFNRLANSDDKAWVFNL